MKSEQIPNIVDFIKSNNIHHISMNSKTVQNDTAFFMTKYVKEYLEEAIKAGAKYIISQPDISKDVQELPEDVVLVNVKNLTKAIVEASCHIYKDKPKYMVGVTGTSGKTSTVDYLRQIFALTGHKSASVGTMGILCSDPKIQEELDEKFSMKGTAGTTPNPILMHQVLNFLAKKGVNHAAFEVSSHSLHQGRIDGIKLNAAIFTNLSQDHLDYHKTMEEYKLAKLKIFTDYLAKDGIAIVQDILYLDPVVKTHLIKSNFMRETNNLWVVGDFESDFNIHYVNADLSGQKLTFEHKNTIYETHLDMVGSFQSVNVSMAVAAALASGIDMEQILPILPKLKAVAGRLDRITTDSHPYYIFTDYAHKPEALESCLKELKNLCKSKLLLVFGCGGNRDKGKRKIMAEIAAKFADVVIVTDDNPRLEDPDQIRKDVMEWAKGAIEIGPRDEAIGEAIKMMGDGDVLLVAGKGHEDYMEVASGKIYFSDAEEVRKHI